MFLKGKFFPMSFLFFCLLAVLPGVAADVVSRPPR